MISDGINREMGMDAFLAVVRALSHPERVRVVKLLQYTSMGKSELAGILEESESEVQDHVSVLTEAQIIVPVQVPKTTKIPAERECFTVVCAVMKKLGPGVITAMLQIDATLKSINIRFIVVFFLQ